MGRRKSTYKKDDADSKIIERITSYIGQATVYCESEHSRAEENAGFERGVQWNEADAQRQAQKERPALPLNSIHKLLNAVANKEIMDRFRPRVHARGAEDGGIAQLLDLATVWQRDMAEAEHEETMAFRKMCASGYGVMHKWWDPSQLDGDGCIMDEEVPIWQMLWDPLSRKQNLVDRKWHLCGKYVDMDDAEFYFGEKKEGKQKYSMLKNSSGRNDVHYGGDETVHSGPYTGTWGNVNAGRWMSMSGNEVFIVEAEWKERKQFYRVAMPTQFQQFAGIVTGDPEAVVQYPVDNSTIDAEAWAAIPEEEKYEVMKTILGPTTVEKYESKAEFNQFLDQYEGLVGEPFEDYARGYRDTVQYAVMTDGYVLSSGERLEGYTYEFMTGFPYETSTKIQFYGMVDVAKAPQDFKNVFYSNLLTLYMTSPKQHLIVEEGALKDTQKFLNEYSKVSGVSIVPDGFVQGGRFLQLDPPRFPPMLETLIGAVDNNVQDIFGLSSIESNSQQDLRRITSGVVQAAKAATNTLLAILFDGLRRYRKRWGYLSSKTIMSYYSPQELLDVVGEQVAESIEALPEPIAALRTWPKYIKFDIKIDESPASITEQIETVDWMMTSGTIEKWVAAGELPFEAALDLLITIPKSVRDSIKKQRNQQQKIKEQISALQSEIQKQMELHQSFIKFLSSREGGAQILADFALLQVLATARAEELVQQQQEQAAPQNGEIQ